MEIKYMIYKSRILSQSIRVALAASLMTGGSLAWAQDDADEQEMESVTVTGSRVPRADRETAQPILVVSREDLQKSGFTSVGDVLQRLAEVGPSINTQFNTAVTVRPPSTCVTSVPTAPWCC
jgi:iron complex outermembrane receptor protein